MKKQLNKKGFTLIELLVVITIIGVLATISFSGYSRFIENARITKTVAVAKNVFNAMTSYASDNNGKFPKVGEATRNGGAFNSAEDVFREFMVREYSSDEGDFGVDNSPVTLDGYIGEAPTYTDAFSSADGGVHWAVLGDGTQTMRGSTPLAWENSISKGWDPTWDPELAGTADPGRTWSGGKIVLVTVSGKAEPLELENTDTVSKLKTLGTGSKNVFTSAYTTREVLDPTLN